MAAGNDGRLGTLAVLAVDDHAINRDFLRNVLGPRVGSLALASNGREAVDLCARERFDVVLMDLHMPDMDGVGAWRRILRTRPDRTVPRVIALTADSRTEERERLRDAGFDGYLAKPVAPDVLLSALDRVVAGVGRFLEHGDESVEPPAFLDDARGLKVAGSAANLEQMRAALRPTLDAEAAAIDAALAEYRFDDAAERLHRCRGACTYCGADRLERACAMLEDSLRGRRDSSRGALYVEFRRALAGTSAMLDDCSSGRR
ncbi:MAG: response regulator [Candidatus Wenzhouxiangella sp. M2_3B_020]